MPPTPRARAPATSPPLTPAESELVLFVSCVRDKPVTRLPLPGSRARGELIGAVREKRAYSYNEDDVIGITRAEVEAHGPVYERTIAEKHLRRRTREDFEAWRATCKARAKEAAETAAEAAKAEGDGS